MFDLHCLGDLLGNFSRSHCIAICAFLVPANLIATSQTLLFMAFKRSPTQMFVIITAATIYALLMILHVISWLIVGVVMAPTFILMFLGLICAIVNFIAIWLTLNHIQIDFIAVLRRFFPITFSLKKERLPPPLIDIPN